MANNLKLKPKPAVAQQPKAQPPKVSVTMSLRAKSFAEILDKDQDMSEAMSLIIQAKEITDQKAFTVMGYLRKDFAERLDELPIPDSEHGNNPDLYPVQGTKRKGHFYYDLFDLWSFGAAIIAKLDQCKLAMDDNTADKVKDQEVLAAMKAPDGGLAVQKLKTRYENKRNHGRRVMLDAAKLHFKLAELSEVDGLLVQFNEDDQSPKPIVVRDADLAGTGITNAKQYSVGQILKIDIDKVVKSGGGWDGWLEATKRKPRPDKVEGEEEIAVTFKTAPQVLENTVDFFQAVEDDAKELGRFYKEMNHNDALCLAVFRLHDQLSAIVEKPTMRERYANLEAGDSQDGRPRTDGKVTEAA